MQVSEGYAYQSHNSRVTFDDTTAGKVWALVFPSQTAAEAFVDTYTQKLFENTYSKPYNPANFQKVLSASCCHCSLGQEPAADCSPAAAIWCRHSNGRRPTRRA